MCVIPYYQKEGITIYHGDCLEVLPGLDENSIDSIVTDPPYGLSFMGRDWDHGVPGEHFWREVIRVAKPGAHLLAFGGTRTFHRLTSAIEDAGFEIRDCIMWVYASGFPKSHDIGKAIDREAGETRPRVPGGQARPSRIGGSRKCGEAISGEAISGEAKQWNGWGTALKPAWEPIIIARKPIEGTIARNVLKWGTGGINVDGCRVGVETRYNQSSGTLGAGRMRNCNLVDRGDGKTPDGRDLQNIINYKNKSSERAPEIVQGRWPANLIHDGSEEVWEGFPETDGGGKVKNQPTDLTAGEFNRSE